MPAHIFRLCSTARRGVALLLVTIAVMVSSIIAYTYLAAQETSIGIARNIRNHAKARYIAESGLDLAMATIKANGNWRTTYTSGTNWITDVALLGGTVTIMGEDGKDSDGDGVITIPTEGDGNLADDASDAVTLTVTGKFSGATHVVRAALTPVAGNSIVVYGGQNLAHVYYRTVSGSSWSTQASANDVGNNPKWYVAKYCPKRTEISVLTLNTANDIYLQFWTGSAWTNTSTLMTGDAGISSERPCDAAYEQISGNLLLAYREGSGGNLRYRTATNSSTVSVESSYALPTAGNVKWVRLVPKPSSDEIMALTLDGSKDVAAAVWNGSSWGNSITLETSAKTSGNEEMTAAYEGLSGAAVVAWVENSKKLFHYRIWSAGSWSSVSDGPLLTKEPQWLKLVADPTSDKMVMASLDGSGNITLLSWDGSAWGSSPLIIETNASATDSRCFDVAYEKTGGKAIAVWGRSTQNNFFYRTWNGSAWSNEISGPGLTDKVSFAQLINDGSQNRIYLTILQKGSGAIESLIWNGASLNTRVELINNASGPNNTESYMVASSPSSSGGGSTSSYKVDMR